ncbi:MAG: helix-turn-helix domain-containing protein [Bellilinea sp.]|jgi:hypothetical protein
MTQKSRLTNRQHAAVAYLAAGLTTEQTGQAVGVTAQQVRRWLALPHFAAELRAAQDAVLSDVVRSLSGGAREMLSVLRNIAIDGDITAQARVRAALGWLDALWKAREQGELSARLAAIEQRLAELDDRS